MKNIPEVDIQETTSSLMRALPRIVLWQLWFLVKLAHKAHAPEVNQAVVMHCNAIPCYGYMHSRGSGHLCISQSLYSSDNYLYYGLLVLIHMFSFRQCTLLFAVYSTQILSMLQTITTVSVTSKTIHASPYSDRLLSSTALSIWCACFTTYQCDACLLESEGSRGIT